MRTILITTLFCIFLPIICSSQIENTLFQWNTVEAQGEPVARHECAFVECNDKFYLMGGRRINPVTIFDPAQNSWTAGSESPIELHHFQAVAYKDDIWVIGAQTGKYPHETPVPNIYIYHPLTDKWEVGPQIPNDVQRSSCGLVLYKDRFFLICGIIDGHWGNHSKRVDIYDPQKNSWQRIPDAPRVRDHFMAAIIDDKIYCAGGRVSSGETEQVFELTIPQVDVYNLKTGEWSTLPSTLPTLRAGCTSVAYKGRLIVLNGEAVDQKEAHAEVDVYNTKKSQWETLPNLNEARHGTQAILYKKRIYIAAGSANKGGGPELKSMISCDLKQLK